MRSRCVAHLLDAKPETVRIGMPVATTFDAAFEGLAMPDARPGEEPSR